MKTAADRGTSSRRGDPSRPSAIAAWVTAKFRDGADGEHELAVYRLALGALAGCYLLISAWLEARGGQDLLRSTAWLLGGFELASLGIFCHLLWRPGGSVGRRAVGMLLDFGALSYCMHIGGETALPLYPLYFLAMLTNGSRFGTPYLLAAADTAVASFALVTVATEFFAAQPGLSIGLLGGLLVPPLQIYSVTRELRRPRPQAEAANRVIGLGAAGGSHTFARNVTSARKPAALREGSADLRTLAIAETKERPMRRYSVLLAEDNATNGRVIAKVLEKAGHEVEVVDNGQAAAEAVAKHAFDAVLMDLEMPILDGIEGAKLIRFLSTGRSRIPIIGLASRADEGTRRRCEEAGMDACTAKPIEPAALLRVLEEVVAVHEHDAVPQSPSATESATPGAAGKHRPSALDVRTLESLKALGGDEFVEELAQQFIDDAEGVLEELSQAVAKGDAQGFREHAHALRSGAANIGAQGVYEMCLGWRRIDPATLSSKGNTYIGELEQEFGRVRDALQDYREYRAARKRSASGQRSVGA